uniref:Uncharacterized protein n=1 Tax=Cyprinus carpio TaxID=7962 RepID=A0A8C1ZFP3_CYPCA
MAYPVDILTNVDYETLELTAEEYMSQLPYRNTEYFSLSDSKQIEIGLCNVSFVPLYGADTEKKLLALFSPDNSNTVVGLYLLDRWWRVEDVLKTAEPSRTGLNKVSTLGERIVLYVLNRIVLRNEKSSEDVFFLCHCEHEAAKILWKDGEAIGFYSFKPKGSLCRNFLTQCYLLPVMDTVFVRKCHRGQGHAIKILEDFVGSFRNEYIGLKFPLSEAMYKVCEKYFSIYPEDKELLWEVEKIGSPFQRTLIANRLQKLKLKEKDQVVSKLDFDEDDATAPMEIEITRIQETTEHTMEIVEETIIDITKEVDDIPVTRRGRGSNLKRRAIRENSEERLSENIIRVEEIEAGVESSVEVAAVENLNTFSVKESETVLRSSVDTVTATVTNFAEFRGSQKEEMHDIEKDIVTATSEGSPVTHLTTAGEIKNQRSSKEECEMVIKEYTIDIQGATIGSIEQNQLQSVVDVEIVKMSTGTEEEKNENLGKNKEVEEDDSVCEAEMEEIKQMPDKPREEKTVSETEVPEQSETHAKSTEKVQAHWDMEITENKERAEDEVMAESEKDLIEENRDDNTGQEKTKSKDEDTVLQSVVVEDQIEMEADSVREVLTTEEVLCDQPKQNEAETEVSEPNQTMSNKDTLIEKASKHKLGPDEAKQVFNKSRLPQKRSSGLTPSRRSKRLRHEPAEKDLTTTKSVKTGQQGSKHHSKVMMQDEDIEQSTDEPKAESEVEEYKEKDMPTVETVSSMDVEITQVEETVFPEVSKLVERKETDPEKAPLQSSLEPPEIQESKTTPEEDDETVENSTVMLTLSEAKVVLVDLHELSSKEAGDNHGEISVPEQEEMKLTMSSELQATEENMRKEEQDGTLDTKPMEEPACTTTTEGYVVAADANRTPDQSAAYKDQENEPESETTEVVLLSQVEKPEKTDTEQDKEDKQDLYEADNFPKQGKQTQKKGSIDIPSRSTRLKDQSVDPGQTVRCLRSTLKPVKITPVRRSARSKAVIQQMESVEPQVDAKLRTDDNPERDELIAEDVSPEENEMANTNAEEIASVECGSSELLRAAEIDDKEKEPQITKVTEEIPLIETEAKEDVLENRVEDIKNIENKEANLAGQLDSDIEMSSLAQEVYVQEEEVPISTERHLRRRTIRVQTPLTRKSRCIKKQKAEADVEHQERHTVMSKNKTDTILMTKEREDEMDQDVNKMENKEEHFAELEPVEEQNISRNEYEKTSAITEETVDACIPIFTTEASLESLDEIVNTNTEETAVPESPGLPLGVEIHDQEKRFQIVDGPEEKVSLVEPGKEVENGDGTPVIKLQRATVVLVDLSKLSQNTEGEVEASEDLTHFQMEEKLELYELDKSEQEPSNLTLEEEEQEEVQTQEETEKTPEEEKMEEENTVEEQNKLDKQDMTFEEQKPTEDLATMPAEGSLVESNKIENKHNEDEGVSGLAQENAVQENLEEEAPVSTQRSLRRRTKRVPSPPRRKSTRIQKQGADVSEDKTEIFLITEKEADEMDQGVEIVDKEKVPQTSIDQTSVDATEEVIPLVEAEPEDNVIEKGVDEINKIEDKETNLAVTKDSDEKTPEVEEEANLEQQPLVKNDKETTETEKSMEIDPVVGKEQTFIVGGTTIQIEKEVSRVSLVEAELDEEVEKDDGTPVIQLQIDPVVSKEQTYVVGGTTIEIEETFSQVESTETEQSDNERITKRSLRLSAKSVTATQKTRKSTRLHKVELDPVKETNMSRNEHQETSTTMEETVNVCMPIITVESNLDSLDEIANTNVEETTAVEPETSELLTSEEINDKEEPSKIVEEVPPKEAAPDEEVKDDGTPVMLQKDTLLLVDLNKLSQTTEEQTDTQDVLTHFHTEEQLELYEPDKNDYQLCNLISEEDQQDMTVEGQKPTDDLVGQNDLKERENEEECKMVIVEDVEESVKSGEHPKATTVEGNTNIIQETENQDISLKEKQMNSDLEMRSLGQEAPKAVQEVLEEEASVSTERNLRHRTVKIQSPPIKKSRRAQRKEPEVFEDKTVTVQLTGKGDEEVHKEGAEIDQEETLQKTTVEATENIVSLIERETDENVIKKGFEIINNMENKEANLGNEATHEMERDKVNLEQQENELSVENEKETAETGKPMGMDEGSVVNKEQTYVLEETPIQAEKEILQVESSETNKNKSERTTRRSPVISSQSVPSTQKTRKSARLNKSELEPIKDAEMSRNEETSSMTAKTVNVCLPVTVETNVEYLDGDREDRDVSKRVETTSDEQDQDISNEKGRVDEAEISTDVEDENLTLIEITENDIWLEMDKMQKDVKRGVQEEEKAEPSQENTEQEKEEAVSLGENVGETDLTNVFKTTAVEEMVAFENSDQEAAFITRSLRYRTVTVQSTPRSKSKRFHRQELESERQTDHLNAPIGKENEALIAEDSTAEFENLFEIMESNSGSQVNTEQNKTQEENLEREDMSMLNEQEEEEVSSVQKEAKPLQERENEGAAEGVQGSSADLEETTVERRSLRKRTTVETAASRKSKRLHKQEHDDDSEQVKEAVMGQTDSVEVTFTEDSVELRSDATAAVFEGNNLGEEILQKIQKNGTKSDGECNVHKDTEPGAGESQEEQKQSRLNKTQTDEDKEEVMTDEIIEEVIEQHVDLESSTNEGFTLALEVEGTSDQEENKADEQSGVGMEAQKEISPSAQKCEKGEENISEDDEKGLAIGKHVLQSSSTTASPKRKSMRLQMHESKKKEDESDSESEVQQSSNQRDQRKRKAITDSASARRSKRHVRARIV